MACLQSIPLSVGSEITIHKLLIMNLPLINDGYYKLLKPKSVSQCMSSGTRQSKTCPCRCFPLHVYTERFVMPFAPFSLTSHHIVSCKTPSSCCCRSLKDWVTRALNLIHSHYLWLTCEGALTCIPCTHTHTLLLANHTSFNLTQGSTNFSQITGVGKGGCATDPISPKAACI